MSREALRRVKLDALVRSHWGAEAVESATEGSFPGGAAIAPAAPGGEAFVLVEGATARSLGGVLAWARRHEAGAVNLLAECREGPASVLARRAAHFAFPVAVWRVDAPVVRPAAPAGFFPPPQLPAAAVPLAEILRRAGAEPVVEFGVLTGEVLGLEVARVVVDAAGARIEVGVGSQDREAHRGLEPNRDPEVQLAEVVALIRRMRAPGQTAHLANSLAGERWLRAVLVARPELVGAAWLAPAPPALRRGDLRTPTAAMAAGVGEDGHPVLVAASTGIDLDLVPAAADARQAAGTGARLILAIPPADDHPRTRQLAALLVDPAEVVTVPADWKGMAGTL